MIKVVLFELRSDNQINYEAIQMVEAAYRPHIGDVYFITGLLDEACGLEVESIVCVGSWLIHAYCRAIWLDRTTTTYSGTQGNKGRLIAHTEDQMKDFPERYQGE